MVFLFEGTGDDWTIEGTPLAEGHLCSLCGRVLGAAVAAALTQPVKLSLQRWESSPTAERQFSVTRTLIFVDCNYKKRLCC